MSRDSTLSRREWLAGMAATAMAATSPPRSFGIQLEAVRDALAKEPDNTLKAIAAAGYKDVEGYRRTATMALLPKLKQYGLTARSCVIETPLVTADWENYPEWKPVTVTDAIESLKQAGVDYCAMGVIPAGARGDGDDFFRRTADRMNAFGELCRKAGIKFVWPNQAFEFEGAPGMRPIDIYRERLDPKFVSMEMDVVWVRVARHDPVELLKAWKGRVSLVRLRDKSKDSFAAIGEGEIDFAAVMKAGQSAGAKYYFVYDSSGDFGKALAHLKKI